MTDSAELKSVAKVIAGGVGIVLLGAAYMGGASTSASATSSAAAVSAAASTPSVLGSDRYNNDYGLEVWEHDKIDGMYLVEIPAVTFTQGAGPTMQAICFSGYWPESFNSHRVQLSRFSISRTEVTNAQYVDFLNQALESSWVEVYRTTEDDAWYYEKDEYEKEEGFHFVRCTKRCGQYEGKWLAWLDEPRDEDLKPDATTHVEYDFDTHIFSVADAYADWPMLSVSWYGAHTFAQFYDMSLPTEAQWEYAAGGGREDDTAPWGRVEAKTLYPSESGTSTTDEMNFDGSDMSRGNIEFPTESMPSKLVATAVCSYPENQRGLCDMGGNVYEWVNDWYDEDYYDMCESEPAQKVCGADNIMINPHGPHNIEDPPQSDGCSGGPFAEVSCDTRVRRGGAFNYMSEHTCAFYRASGLPFRMIDHFGFRVVDSIGIEGEWED